MHIRSFASALLFASPVFAFFRINCGIIQTGRVDPIINPGAVSAHVHTIVGASNVGVNATYESLLNSECTSCEVQADHSAYWTPLLYYAYANGSFAEVPHSGSVVYYLLRGGLLSGLTRFPAGFRMVSGKPGNRAYNQSGMTWGNATYAARPQSEAVTFACLAEDTVPMTYNMVNVQSCINGFRAQLHFQTCWNGVDLYLSDNSHVAYLNQIDNGICPPGYPYQLPHLFLETDYAPADVEGTDDGGQFVWSMGDPTGYGFHGDFFNGWNASIFDQALTDCLENNLAPDGTIEECPILLEYDSSEAMSNCPEQPAEVNETVHGLLSRLPGCITIAEGPDAATAADMQCAAGVAQPSIIQTADSVPLATYMPTIGQADGGQVYLGCGNDSFGSPQHAVNALYYQNTTSMTAELCQAYCNSRGYRISALEYGTECYCDLAVNPSAVLSGNYYLYTGCTLLCPGNRTEICGGSEYVSIWNNTSPTFNSTTDLTGSVLPLSYPLAAFESTYVGCATEVALNGTFNTFANMTIDYCGALCTSQNYAMYGLSNGDICACGNALAPGISIVDTITTSTGSNCGIRCPGNFSQVCGSAYYYSVYNNTAYTAAAITKSVGKYFSKGCLSEPTTAGIRALAGVEFDNTTAMSPGLCVGYCENAGYKYAGIEYASQCFCANTISAGAEVVPCETWNLMHCPGDSLAFCGMGNVLNLYFSITKGA